MIDIALLAAVLAVASLFRTRSADWPLTTPMLFVASGVVMGPDVLGLFAFNLEDESVALAAEITLAMLLFSDAARIDTMSLRRSLGLPLRLLGIGLPLTVALGTAMTALLLTDLSWAEAGLIAAILSPTDAALGQAVVSNKTVPVFVRQALNVESGLNDGLIVPVVAVFAVLAAGDELDGTPRLIAEASSQVALGIVTGAVIGWLLGKVIAWVEAHNWSDADGLRLATFGGALACFGAATWLGGNGFIAAFVCGIALHLVLQERAGHHAELAEDAGQIGAAAAFVMFGATMVVPALEFVSLPVMACALGTLTIGRMLPVAVATFGTKMMRPTVAFLGWFGPRGLASMLFGVLIVAERGSEVDDLFSIITLVIFASVMLHGVSAAPGARRYARWFSEMDEPGMPESTTVPETRTRGSRLHRS